MRIAGLEKNSIVDYPGHMAAVLFTPGCNMDCYYCHNRHLLAPGEEDPTLDSGNVMNFLRQRVGFLDAVVISGGEPTLQKDLAAFIADVKDLGYAVKLDTNGTKPWVTRSLIEDGLVDFVAMDIKAPRSRYEEIVGRGVNLDAIEESIDLLMKDDIDYEFRTTFAPELQTSDILRIARRIHGARQYVLQQFRPPGLGVDMFGLVDSAKPHETAYVYKTAKLAGVFVEQCLTRGLDVPAEVAGSYVSDSNEEFDKSTLSIDETWQ
ncbi:MAG: anaerobic ribonucleoside-triphosphate reductase activating protein [Phycisphaerae bacterium]|nr:anaerobic ribonucleoside-triphosphate reductase activating protein [Phycisphaerae bacterium]